MLFLNGCMTRYYTTESKMGFLRRNGLFPPASFKSALLARLLFWCVNHWPLHQLTCLVPFFRRMCLVESPKTSCEGSRAESRGVRWVLASSAVALQLQQQGSVHGQMGEQEEREPWSKITWKEACFSISLHREKMSFFSLQFYFHAFNHAEGTWDTFLVQSNRKMYFWSLNLYWHCMNYLCMFAAISLWDNSKVILGWCLCCDWFLFLSLWHWWLAEEWCRLRVLTSIDCNATV